jgi:hypothetical protein
MYINSIYDLENERLHQEVESQGRLASYSMKILFIQGFSYAPSSVIDERKPKRTGTGCKTPADSAIIYTKLFLPPVPELQHICTLFSLYHVFIYIYTPSTGVIASGRKQDWFILDQLIQS